MASKVVTNTQQCPIGWYTKTFVPRSTSAQTRDSSSLNFLRQIMATHFKSKGEDPTFLQVHYSTVDPTHRHILAVSVSPNPCISCHENSSERKSSLLEQIVHLLVMDSDSELQQSKRRRSHQGEDQSVIGMENLPHEIIAEVTSRLPFSSLVKFRYVCRAWKNLDLRIFDTLHNSNTADKNNLCLIFHCDYPIRNHIYFVDYPFHHGEKETMLVKKIHPPFCGSMPEFDVVGSCDGLLCLSDSLYNDAVCIYNPFTRDHRELPKSVRFPNQEVIYGFGFHPITKEYKVVKIVYYSRQESWSRFRVYRPQSEVQVFTLGTSDWRSLGRTSHYLHHWPAQVLVNGRLHWVTWRKRYHPGRKLISFDLGDEQFREVPKPEGDGLSRWNYHVLVVRGCLAAFFYCSYGKLEMWVMEEYGVKESWGKVLTIGSYVPKTLKQDVDRSWKISKIVKRVRHVRALCVLGSGQILLEYKSRALVVYEPSSGKFKDLLFQGMPKWFQTVVHEGTLNPIHTLVNM